MEEAKSKTIEVSEDKRSSLGKIALGSSLLWVKPFVGAVVLPAHAQTSTTDMTSTPQPSLSDPCTLEILAGTSSTTYSVEISGQIVGTGNDGLTVDIEVVAGGQSFSTTAVSDGSGAYGPVTLGAFDVCLDADDPVATVTSVSFPGSATCTAQHGLTCLDAQFVDPCSATIVEVSFTTYRVRVSGQITGLDNANRSVDINVTAGSQSFDVSVNSNGSGAYGPVDSSIFDVNTDAANPVVTVTSAEFAGSAMCTVNHGK